MSRVIDWCLGRVELKKRLVELEKKLKESNIRREEREGQIVSAAKYVRGVKSKRDELQVRVTTLEFENNLLKRIPG